MLRLHTILFCVNAILLPQAHAARACPVDLALLASNPSFHQLAKRVLSPDSDGPLGGAEGTPNQVKLTTTDVENLFSDTDDPWMQRMGRFLRKGVESGDIKIVLVGDKHSTDYSAGTCWSGSCGNHSIEILLDPGLMGGNPTRNGIRAAARSTLIHEAMHARINDYLIKWLEQQAIDPADWRRRLSTTTEEYMARIGDQRAIGRTGISANTRAWFDTWIGAGDLINPWTKLETAWTKKLKEGGVKLEDRPQRLVELAAQKVRKQEARDRQRGWTQRDVQGQISLKELRTQLIARGKINETQWGKFEEALIEELHPQWGRYHLSDLAKAAERHAPIHLGIVIKGEYSTNHIYSLEVGK